MVELVFPGLAVRSIWIKAEMASKVKILEEAINPGWAMMDTDSDRGIPRHR